MQTNDIEGLAALLNERKAAIVRRANDEPLFREQVNLCLDLRAYRIERALRDAGFEEASLVVRNCCTIEALPFFPRMLDPVTGADS